MVGNCFEIIRVSLVPTSWTWLTTSYTETWRSICDNVHHYSLDYVTGFKKTQLPHIRYQTYDFTRHGLLAQCTCIFHCVPCSNSQVWFLWQLISDSVLASSGDFPPLAGHGSLLLVLKGLGKLRRAGQYLSSSVVMLWAQRRSNRTPNWTSGFQSSLYWAHPPLLLLPRAIIITLMKKKLLKITWILGVWKLFTHTITANE